MSLISKILNCLFSVFIFTQLDLQDTYIYISIKKSDKWKTAFCMWYKHYKYQVLLFELTNIFITFQVYINKTLSSLLDVCCIVYLDNILIYSQFRDQHQCHVCVVLECLRKYWLYVKLSKCSFEVDTVNFLDFIISPRGLKIKRSHIQIILE